VLIAATDIGRYNFKNDTVFAFPIAQGQLGIFNFLNSHFTGLDVRYSMILAHIKKFKVENSNSPNYFTASAPAVATA
jgi:hypothetical protein